MIDIYIIYEENADKSVASQQKAYMRNQFTYLGLKAPIRRALSKDYLKEVTADKSVDWELIEKLWNEEYREYQDLACDILKKLKKTLTPADLPKIKKIAQIKSWWDTIDNLDELVGAIAQNHPEAKRTILDWSLDEDFWIRRLAIDHQLGFKDKTDLELLAKIIQNNLAGSDFEKEFFINKSIGWALRDLSKANPDWVRTFLAKNESKMKKLSIKEAGKYI